MSAAQYAFERSGNPWTVAAMDRLFVFARKHKAFTCEMVRAYAEKAFLSTPPDKRAWGRVMQRAAAEGWIESTNLHVTARDKTVHRRPVRVWKSRIVA
jgi:hypothetical protein